MQDLPIEQRRRKKKEKTRQEKEEIKKNEADLLLILTLLVGMSLIHTLERQRVVLKATLVERDQQVGAIVALVGRDLVLLELCLWHLHHYSIQQEINQNLAGNHSLWIFCFIFWHVAEVIPGRIGLSSNFCNLLIGIYRRADSPSGSIKRNPENWHQRKAVTVPLSFMVSAGFGGGEGGGKSMTRKMEKKERRKVRKRKEK